MRQNSSKCWTQCSSFLRKSQSNSRFFMYTITGNYIKGIHTCNNFSGNWNHFVFQHNVLSLVDWCEVCGWGVVVSGCHVQLLRARPHVHILPNRSTGATIQKVPLVEKVSQKSFFFYMNIEPLHVIWFIRVFFKISSTWNP